MSDADYVIITTHPYYYDNPFFGLGRTITYYYKIDIDKEDYVELGKFKENIYQGYIRESRFILPNKDEPTIYSVKNEVFLNYNNNKLTDRIYIYKKITKGGKRRKSRKSRKSKRTRKSMKTMKNRK
jgi:hypothetical protein